ncbi:hypothetical protein Hamer_G007027 [Homarus americanus]|uniref:Uncharacterized protein n=1 Tax=Homarus americanus TaxID=6706 RepID=A0A8J5T5D3_HOMAM|nr:hypothetical protein Hamer_G007027 [Homarus americanus]
MIKYKRRSDLKEPAGIVRRLRTNRRTVTSRNESESWAIQKRTRRCWTCGEDPNFQTNCPQNSTRGKEEQPTETGN